MKETAVNWLIDNLIKLGYLHSSDYGQTPNVAKVIKQSKEMENQNMADKWQEGYDACEFHNDYENLQIKPINNPYRK